MTESKRKSLKFKILFFGSAIFILSVLIVTIVLFLSADISDEELGPSPFLVETTHTDDNNIEFQNIVGLGKSIIGTSDFIVTYKSYNDNSQIEIQQLQDYLGKNSAVLEKINLELFQNCKFPMLKVNDATRFENIPLIQAILKLWQHKIRLLILTNNYEEAKQQLILSHQVNNEMLMKGTVIIDYMLFSAVKSIELENAKLLINLNSLNAEQKMEILSIYQDEIPLQCLKNTFHFEIEYMRDTLKSIQSTKMMPRSLSDLNYLPIFSSINYQPNKSTRLVRAKVFDIIKLVEKPEHISYTKLMDRIPIKHDAMEFLNGNYGGSLMMKQSELFFKMIATKFLSNNNNYHQMMIAQKLLAYKIRNGSFPVSLTELKVDPNLYTDICNGALFLYSADNGILQSVGKDKKNDYPDLTTKVLSASEIHEILKNADKDFILYLK